LFAVGTLHPGEERDVRITGTLSGQNGEDRVFRFTAGSLKDASSRDFGVSYTSNDTNVTIAKPFLTVGLNLNREEAPTVVAKAGESIVGLLSWTNALQTAIQDGVISVTFGGEALGTGAIDTTNGFYSSSNKTVQYNRDTVAGLANLNPGDTGNGMFTFTTKTGTAMTSLRNPTITLAVSVSGRRIGENKVPETVTSTLTRTIKIQTDLALTMRSAYTEGSFKNTGPRAPEVDKETTYTILLSAANTVNTVANTAVKMTLPSYVRFTGQTTPAGVIKYNEATREVTWTLGDVAPAAVKEAAFQVALLPSVSQKGTSPVLVSGATITGVDRFVQKEVSATASSVSTETKTDAGYQGSFGSVK
jgi:hypothetical protein